MEARCKAHNKSINCHCQRKPGRAHGSRSADSFQIPTTDYLSDMILKYSLFNMIGFFSSNFDHPPCFWLICIRLPSQIWGNLCKLFFLPLASFLCSNYPSLCAEQIKPPAQHNKKYPRSNQQMAVGNFLTRMHYE